LSSDGLPFQPLGYALRASLAADDSTEMKNSIFSCCNLGSVNSHALRPVADQFSDSVIYECHPVVATRFHR